MLFVGMIIRSESSSIVIYLTPLAWGCGGRYGDLCKEDPNMMVTWRMQKKARLGPIFNRTSGSSFDSLVERTPTKRLMEVMVVLAEPGCT
jgi:hypothetical protein